MVPAQPKNIRVRFQKIGRLKYISHLDLCRTMSHALIRAKIPFWYTEGFNPHPKMVFSLPVPLFCESVCEFLDIKIIEDVPCSELLTNLQNALPHELNILEVYSPNSKLTEITHAKYEIISDTSIDFNTLLSSPVIVTKKTKSGEKSLDIRPQIQQLSYISGKITCILDASNISYLNPELFCLALGLSDYYVTRTEWYARGGIFK